MNPKPIRYRFFFALSIPFLLVVLWNISSQAFGQQFENGEFVWKVERPFLAIDQTKLPQSNEHPWVSVKDPSIVRFENRWHLFCTLRKNKKGDGRIRIGYLSFDNFTDAKNEKWNVLELTPGYHGAPQIFWFEPKKLWFLIYQAEDSSRGLNYGPCYSTNKNIDDPEAWSKPEPLYVVPKGSKAGLDFWVICNQENAFLFFTALNGQMWRSQTSINSFPNRGWSKPEIALRADIFEASHTYKIKGQAKYVTIVEAQGSGRRYFKAYTASKLNGAWKPLASTKTKPLVSPANVANQGSSWATSYSHGEFIRSGHDQYLEIDLEQPVRLLFQGANDQQYRNRNYGQIPWKLGILKMKKNN